MFCNKFQQFQMLFDIKHNCQLSIAYIANLPYFIRNGNVIMLFVIKRDLFVAQIKIKLL